MAYPTLDQYNEAVQWPQTAFIDPELQQGRIETNSFGLPLAFCGNFALAYNMLCGQKRYAVRCFHKPADKIAERYQAIAQTLHKLHSPYFVDFVFQPQGIKVGSQVMPVVKMAWAHGQTLGDFVEEKHTDAQALKNLRLAFLALANFLETNGIAHGDIQTGNVIVSQEGKSIQLVDYDGMYVPALAAMGSSELGHRNFQHPLRDQYTWTPSLDRFSCIVIALALLVLEKHPQLWEQTKSNSDTILFTREDFCAPQSSWLFGQLQQDATLAPLSQRFIAICQGSFDAIPSLASFVGTNSLMQIYKRLQKFGQQHFGGHKTLDPSATASGGRATTPSSSAAPSSSSSSSTATASSAVFPLLDASNYLLCLQYIGCQVELLGKIVDVLSGTTKDGRSYSLLTFGRWGEKCIKAYIWTAQRPSIDWIGKWVSVVGTLEPPFTGTTVFNYADASISVVDVGQLQECSEQQALTRLASVVPPLKSQKPSSLRLPRFFSKDKLSVAIGLIICVLFFALSGDDDENVRSRSVLQEQNAIPYQASLMYSMPEQGKKQELSISEMRWCQREELRIAFLQQKLTLCSTQHLVENAVNEYRQRCANARVSEEVLAQASRDTKAQQRKILADTRTEIAQIRSIFLSSDQLTGQESIRAAQRQLRALGYYNGYSDGIIGERTRDAVRAFQADNNMRQDGVLSHYVMEFVCRRMQQN